MNRSDIHHCLALLWYFCDSSSTYETPDLLEEDFFHPWPCLCLIPPLLQLTLVSQDTVSPLAVIGFALCASVLKFIAVLVAIIISKLLHYTDLLRILCSVCLVCLCACRWSVLSSITPNSLTSRKRCVRCMRKLLN